MAGYPGAYQNNGGIDTTGVTLAPPPCTPPYSPHVITSIAEDEEPEETDGQVYPDVHSTKGYDNNSYSNDINSALEKK